MRDARVDGWMLGVEGLGTCRVSVTTVLSVGDLSSCGAGAVCSFGGLLVLVLVVGFVVCVFILGGSCGFSLGNGI